MYRIRIIAAGRLKEPFWQSAQSEYLKRLSAHARVSISEVPERRVDTPGGIPAGLAAESKDILAAIPVRTVVIALCIQGTRMDSVSFARAAESVGLTGGGSLCFLIGGSHGLHDDVVRRADLRLSLSDMTLPHALARVFLLEQLYRTFTILNGEAYHK